MEDIYGEEFVILLQLENRLNNDYDYNVILSSYKFNENTLEKYFLKHIAVILMYQNVSEKFLTKHKNIFTNNDWKTISKHIRLSEEFMIKFNNNLDFKHLIRYQTLSMKFINRYIKKIKCYNYWNNLCEYQNLTEEFIKAYLNNFSLSDIFTYQRHNLSQKFIQKYGGMKHENYKFHKRNRSK